MYSLMLADNLNLDVEEIIKEKIDINAKISCRIKQGK